MHICIVYDCLFPWTIGGAERWMRDLAEVLAQQGHSVTYFTLRQWADSDPPAIPGVNVVATGPRMALYTSTGKRRIWPPIRFGLGFLWHLLRYGQRYDLLHMVSFPYFQLLAAAALQPIRRYRLSVDWFEVWSFNYWRNYLGPLAFCGWFVQKLCARIPQQAHVFSRLHENRLKSLGLSSPALKLDGLYQPKRRPMQSADPGPPTLIYIGRLIPEKRVELLMNAVAIAVRALPELRVKIVGDGPLFDELSQSISALGLESVIEMTGFVDDDALDRIFAGATALAQPSSREGYGLVVVEAAARGIPSIVVTSEDNAAVELVETGVNGMVVPEADPALFADAIVRIIGNSDKMKHSTSTWYQHNFERLTVESSLKQISRQLSGTSAANRESCA